MSYKIYIEGNIGSGKSTFARLLTDYIDEFKHTFNTSIIQEPVDEWLITYESDGKNILQKFYEDINRWSFAFQMNSFISRTKKIQDEIEKVQNNNNDKLMFIERSIYTDKNVFAINCFENKKMTEMEYNIYNRWNQWLSDKFDLRPSAYIYLRCNPEINSERIIKRSRSEEDSIPIEYLTQIHEKHEEWMNKEKEQGVPVLIIDATDDFTKKEKMDELFKKIMQFVMCNVR